VTLGRALVALDELEAAQRELELVRRTAPDNIAAIRALAEIHGRLPTSPEPLAPVSLSLVAPARPLVAPSSAPARTAVLEPAPANVSTIDDVAYLRTVRTLAALESWLAAIHVTRAKRRA
jgi:hypothetical protein